MKYNKKYLHIDENNIIHPVTGKYGSYETWKYNTQITSIFENQNVEKLSFELDGYIITIYSKDLKITKEKRFREDGSIYWLVLSQFKSGGDLTEFLAYFNEDEKEWLGFPGIHFEKIVK